MQLCFQFLGINENSVLHFKKEMETILFHCQCEHKTFSPTSMKIVCGSNVYDVEVFPVKY